jgi:hypothetical protein
MRFQIALVHAYSKLFPLSSVRRFIMDQVISWFLFLSYYVTIILAVTSLISFVLYTSGYVVINYFNIEFHKGPRTPIGDFFSYLGFGYLVLCGVAIVVGIVWGILVGTYYGDYVPWQKEQKEYIKELENGKPDIEAEFIPVTTNKFQKYSYIVLPLGSVYRYIGRIVLIITIACIILYIYCYLSILIFPFKTMDNKPTPWLIQWFLSFCIQFLAFLLIMGIGACIEPSCTKEWKKFRLQRESAANRKE